MREGVWSCAHLEKWSLSPYALHVWPSAPDMQTSKWAVQLCALCSSHDALFTLADCIFGCLCQIAPASQLFQTINTCAQAVTAELEHLRAQQFVMGLSGLACRCRRWAVCNTMDATVALCLLQSLAPTKSKAQKADPAVGGIGSP